MTSKPLIGILPAHNENRMIIGQDYVDAVTAAGGIPVILPYTEDPAKLRQTADELDGFLFTGGLDVDPVRYGETKEHDSVEIDEARDRFEFAAFPFFYGTGKPILGICRGLQVLNVLRGGTLFQHIEGHRQTEKEHEARPKTVRLEEGSTLKELTGKNEIYVNSFHHQAVKDLAPGLKAEAFSEDGYVEAFKDPKHRFFYAVQFHPERYFNAPDDDHSHKIFEIFVKSCIK